MSFQSDLVVGFAELLADAGLAQWEPTGAYSSSSPPPIFERALPPSPDAAVMLSTYPITDDPTSGDSVIGLQIQTRTAGSDPRTTDDLSDSIFNLLHGRWSLRMNGIDVVSIERHSGLPLGQDDVKRWVVSDNYYVAVNRPSAYRV